MLYSDATNVVRTVAGDVTYAAFNMYCYGDKYNHAYCLSSLRESFQEIMALEFVREASTELLYKAFILDSRQRYRDTLAAFAKQVSSFKEKRLQDTVSEKEFSCFYSELVFQLLTLAKAGSITEKSIHCMYRELADEFKVPKYKGKRLPNRWVCSRLDFLEELRGKREVIWDYLFTLAFEPDPLKDILTVMVGHCNDMRELNTSWIPCKEDYFEALWGDYKGGNDYASNHVLSIIRPSDRPLIEQSFGLFLKKLAELLASGEPFFWWSFVPLLTKSHIIFDSGDVEKVASSRFI